MKIIRQILLVSGIVTILGLMAGCEGDPKTQLYVYPEPVVESIYPTTGYTGSQLAILGENFGDRVEPVKVFFGDIEAKVLACKNDMIIVVVPEDARTCDISLKIWNYEYAAAGHFIVADKPVITGLSTDNPSYALFGRKGDVLTITGTSFGEELDDVKVAVGEMEAEVSAVSDTEIKAVVPGGYGYGEVAVTVRGYQTIGGRILDPDYVGDITSYALVNYCQPFKATDDAPLSNWCIPVGWSFNDKFYSDDNGEKVLMRPLLIEPNGNFKTGCLGFLSNQWSDALHKIGYENAKLYQTCYLPAGEYEVTVDVAESALIAGTLEAIAAVSKGKATLPDLQGEYGKNGWTVADESNLFAGGDGSRSYVDLTSDKTITYSADRGSVPVSFKADIPVDCDVTVGFTGVVKMANGRQGGSVLITGIKVVRIK